MDSICLIMRKTTFDFTELFRKFFTSSGICQFFSENLCFDSLFSPTSAMLCDAA